jgi:hypothetical protein
MRNHAGAWTQRIANVFAGELHVRQVYEPTDLGFEAFAPGEVKGYKNV